MRLQALAVSVLASTGLATPIRRDVSQAIYTLRLTSPVTSLNGLYLTTTSDSTSNTTTLGVYTNPPSPSTPQIKFYPVHNPSTGLSELHTPNSDSDSTTLAVLGTNGLLDLASLADPAAVAVPEGTTLDWTSFSLDEKEVGEVNYAGTVGRWVAFPTSYDPGAVEGGEGDGEKGWSVKWRDVDAWTTQNYMPVQVVYELVQDE